MSSVTSREQNESSQLAFFSPRRLGHVNLWVTDLGASESFYSNVCGLNVEFTEPDLIATFLGTGHTPHDLGMIEKTNGVDRYGKNGLLQLPGTIGLNVGLNHLAWELENEAQLVDGFRRLKESGIETDITVDHQVAHSVYMFDPDGNYNEFYCDTVKDWRTVLGGPMELITSYWDPLAAEGFTEGRYDVSPVLRTHEDAPIKPYRITHAVLQTPNLAELQKFYCDIAGLEVVSAQHGVIYLGAGLKEYDYSLILVESDSANYHHASFELREEEDLDTAELALEKSGAAIEDKIDLPWKRSLFLRDPDGLLSEWYVMRSGRRDLQSFGSDALARFV